jgi:hypothetical protein
MHGSQKGLVFVAIENAFFSMGLSEGTEQVYGQGQVNSARPPELVVSPRN